MCLAFERNSNLRRSSQWHDQYDHQNDVEWQKDEFEGKDPVATVCLVPVEQNESSSMTDKGR